MDVQLLSVNVDSVCPVRRDVTVEDAVVIVFERPGVILCRIGKKGGVGGSGGAHFASYIASG